MGPYRKVLGLSIISMAVLILLAVPAIAQLPTGSILGVAKDSSGGVLPNVSVTVTNLDTGLKRVVMTGDDGYYRVPELPVGRYEVRAEHPGFKVETRTGITLEVTQQAVINLDFQVGTAEQQVVVNAEAPMVNTQDATLGGTVNETKMTELPLNGRNYIDLALLQPGVDKDKNQNNQGGTSFSVNGAPPRSNNFTLDGAVLQNMLGRSPVAGASGDALGLDGIKEFQIVAGTFQAEYGLAMGSQMVAVSKGEPINFTATCLNTSGMTHSMPTPSLTTRPACRRRHFERTSSERPLAAPSKRTRRSSTPSSKELGNPGSVHLPQPGSERRMSPGERDRGE